MREDLAHDTALCLDGISHYFGNVQVLCNVSLTLQPGQVTCLLGPSGCGKSTTLRIAAGIEQQSMGTVSQGARILSKGRVHEPPEARNVGMMFQDFALFPHLDVRRNIGFGLRHLSSTERGKRVDDLLAKIGLFDHAGKFPHQLSGGEQQRVALARALAPRPAVMLMDEPFSGLDDRLRDQVRDATLDLLMDEGTAVLMVTHEPAEAMRLADQIALMRHGEIVQVGAPYNIYNAPVDRNAAAFFSEVNVIEGVCRDALTDTPFGQFLTPGLESGAKVEIVIRPQHLRIDFDRAGKGPNPTISDGSPARGTVKRARFLGGHSLVEFVMDFDGLALQAEVPGVFLPKAGAVFWLTVPRERCFVFNKF